MSKASSETNELQKLLGYHPGKSSSGGQLIEENEVVNSIVEEAKGEDEEEKVLSLKSINTERIEGSNYNKSSIMEDEEEDEYDSVNLINENLNLIKNANELKALSKGSSFLLNKESLSKVTLIAILVTFIETNIHP